MMWTTTMVPDEEDGEFVERLFLENKLAMFITARNIVKDYHTACDMVSESCITMLEKVKYLRMVEMKYRTNYILTIVRNNSLMYLRRRRKEMEILAENRHMFSSMPIEIYGGVDSELIAEAETKGVKEALGKIHKKDSDLLKMKYFERMSDEQIGKVMGIRTASVRFYLTKARRNLEEELRHREEE